MKTEAKALVAYERACMEEARATKRRDDAQVDLAVARALTMSAQRELESSRASVAVEEERSDA